MSVNFDFTGKKVLVTGASQGIGRELSIALASKGAFVYALARNEAALNSLVALNSNIAKIVCDVTASESELKAILEPYQPFHFLVNNAGIAILEPFGEIQEDSLNRTFDVNVKAPILIAQIVGDNMIKENIKGCIVNVSSQAALKPLVCHTTYCASKAALDMLTRCMARELGEKGIRVNSVNPTVVLTDMGRANWSDPNKAQQLLANMSIQHFAEVHDVINSILFLLSEGSAMTTGATLPVDGGFTCQ